MTVHPFTDEKIEQVIRTYSLVHTLFFGLGSVLCMVAIAVGIGYMLFSHASQQNIFMRSDDSVLQEKTILASIQKTLDEYATYEDMHVFIKQWHLSFTGNAIQTTNNLITYKGLVLPRVSTIELSALLPSLDMFTGTSYRSDDLANYIQNTIMIYPAVSLSWAHVQELLDFGNSLIDYFGISCIMTPKVTDHFCQQALAVMTDVLPVYDLSRDIVWLDTIASSLVSTASHTNFCDAIKQYIFFSHDMSETIKGIMYQCGKDYESFYTDFASFRIVEEQLDKQSINSIISPNVLINAYKLISTQQNIYYEMSNGRVNDVRIRSYLKYNEELLRRPESIQQVYFDVMAWFNNSYMIPVLTRLYFQQKWQDTTDIKSLLEGIRMVNEGSKILWYSWLSQFVIDTTLIAPRTQTIIGTWLTLPSLEAIFSASYAFPHFVVERQATWDNDTLTVYGVWSRDSTVWLWTKVSSSLTLRYDGVRFHVVKMTMDSMSRVASAVNTLLQSQTMTIPELYDLLVSDGARFNTTTLSLCDAIRSFSGYVSCTPSQIVFQWYPLATKKTLVTYTINHNDGVLSSYTTDNTSFSQSLRESLGTPQTTTVTMLAFIQSMLNYRQAASTSLTWSSLSWTADMIQVRQDILNLGAKVDAISHKWNGIYTVTFSINKIACVAEYAIATQSLVSLAVVKDGKSYPIRAFSLSLISMDSPAVKAFIADPAAVMMQFDPLTIKKLML